MKPSFQSFDKNEKKSHFRTHLLVSKFSLERKKSTGIFCFKNQCLTTSFFVEHHSFFFHSCDFLLVVIIINKNFSRIVRWVGSSELLERDCRRRVDVVVMRFR